MTSLVFPDINVWLALNLAAHQHHSQAWLWYKSLRSGQELAFCRFTQLGLLRLMTNASVAGEETLNQRQAWVLYDRWLVRGGTTYLDEPRGLEIEFRAFAGLNTSATKDWADSYLAAFAAASSMELVTFDRRLGHRAKRAIILRTSN